MGLVMPFFRSDRKKASGEAQTTGNEYYPMVDPLQESALGPGSSGHAGWGHGASHAAAYPHVPNLAEPSAPPLPHTELEQYGNVGARHLHPHKHQQPSAAGSSRPGQALVATPKIEAQPWVRMAFGRHSPCIALEALLRACGTIAALVTQI